MIRFAVIDRVIEEEGHTMHKIESSGPIKTVRSSDYKGSSVELMEEKGKLVVVLNVKLKGENGKDLIDKIAKNKANVCIYLTQEEEQGDAHNHDGILASADWILMDEKDRNTLVDEIECVFSRGKRISPKIASRIIKFITQPQLVNWELAEKLTRRESQIIKCLVEGLPSKEISEKLGIKHHTVKSHLKNIYTKLGVNNRIEAMLVYSRFQKEQEKEKK